MKAGNAHAEVPFEDYYPTVVSVNMNPTGISESIGNVAVVRTTYYDFSGRQVTADYRGMMIEHTIYDNGRTSTHKYMNQ